MALAMKEESNEGYTRMMPIREFDDETLRLAKNIFDSYTKRGIIINGDFESMSWTLSNETKSVGLMLITFEGGADKKAMEWIGCTYPQYVLCIKAYMLFQLGEVSLDTLRELALRFNRIAVMKRDDVIGIGYNAKSLLEYGTHITALLQLIPGGNEQRDTVIAELDEQKERYPRHKQNGNRRQLADFKSYLRFHEVINNFWLTADVAQRLFYFPLYFWWNLTAILPLRPMEFLLTPRDCLHIRNGEPTLTIRRTKLKRGNEKIGYCVADDYELNEYAINERLAEDLQQYISLTEKMRPPKLDTLLSPEPHFGYFNTRNYSSRYYTYAALNTCRRYFYKEIIAAHDDSISGIRLGDTRHLAMTNLILSGGSPVVCRELAAHANINISAHYYANISNLVECVTLERYRKTKGSELMIYGGAKYFVGKPLDVISVADGSCSSPAYKDGKVDDCLKAVNQSGHIGDCRCCRYFLPDNPGVVIGYFNTTAAKEQVDADSKYLIRMIELVRKGLGYTEDISTALLRLQNSGDRYGKCLWEKYTKEGTLYGTTEES